MVEITLPDGSKRSFDGPVSGQQVAESIGAGLAKAALAIKVNGQEKDLSTVIESSSTLEILTAKTPEGIEVLRHDGAHVLAEAVKELFPETQVTIGPVIEFGFYYDFARETPFSDNDLEKIENRMKEIVDRNETIVREVWKRDEAITYFEKIGEKYKAQIIQDLPGTEEISVYKQGDFLDLCRGPHLPSTGKLGKAFKLMKVSGAYWRGDSNNEMLQRIYGVCFATEKELKKHLTMLEEAAKRDHRVLGKQLGLFHFQEEAPGAVFWHHDGWQIYRLLLDYLRRRQKAAGYSEVNTPEILDKSFWETSGHWEKFSENMFVTETEENRTFCLKPMSCPGAVQIFKQGITSYKDLPLRMAEFGKVHRKEPSGTLHGLLRVRSFTQDDAHIFCSEDQITEESKTICELILAIYKDFGFEDIVIKFSDRPEKRVGDDRVWDKSEKALQDAVKAAGLTCELNPGEGAFYGPKLEFVLRDAIGRDWQAGTLQVDLNLPGRFGAQFVDSEGKRQTPVMIHRALFGSMERFIGILIENYAGDFPLWLAPTQFAVLTISTDNDEYAREVSDLFDAKGMRCKLDLRNEKISYKVREHALSKIPYSLIVGHKEVENREISIRKFGQKKTETMSLDEALKKFSSEAKPPF